MTDEHDLLRPRTTRTARRRSPAFAAPDTGNVPPLVQLAPTLEPPWHKENTDTPESTAAYNHPEDHRIGLRIQPGGHTIQTWITAGPDLPPVPDGTDIEQAEAQAANDARLQPGRTWHLTLSTRTSKALAADLGALVRERLLPALTNKPRRIPTTDPTTTQAPAPDTAQHDTTQQKEGIQT